MPVLQPVLDKLTLKELTDVLKDVALSLPTVGLPCTTEQYTTVALTMRLYWEEIGGEAEFAATADWFRHRTMEKLWGFSSTKMMDQATASTMLTELGVPLSDKGRRLLGLVVAELRREYPTQLSF